MHKSKTLKESKTILTKLRKQNKKFHNLSSNYLERQKPERLKRATKLRNAHFSKLAQTPFFNWLFSKYTKKITFHVESPKKKFVYSILTKGICDKTGKRRAIFVFDEFGRGSIFTRQRIGKHTLWFPTNIALTHKKEKIVFKENIKDRGLTEGYALIKLNEEIQKLGKKIKFIEFDNPRDAEKKMVQTSKYI
jgi:membrane protease subunit (stomatin/prohibitin family)